MDPALDKPILDAGMWVMPDTGSDVTSKIQRAIDASVGRAIVFVLGFIL